MILVIASCLESNLALTNTLGFPTIPFPQIFEYLTTTQGDETFFEGVTFLFKRSVQVSVQSKVNLMNKTTRTNRGLACPDGSCGPAGVRLLT